MLERLYPDQLALRDERGFAMKQTETTPGMLVIL
jgi:hypothetical protein